MSLTPDFLKVLSLSEQDAERILAAHEAAVAALRQEHASALEAAQAEFAAYRTGIEQGRHQEARRAALAEALARFGANPQAIPLMLDACHLREEDWNGDALADEGAALNAIRARYAPLFDTPRTIPTARISPPDMSGGPLTHDDLRRMSPEDINRSWSAVRQALDMR